MSEDNKSVRQLSRRELIRIAGLGGLTVAATGLPVPSPLSTLAAGVQDETPEGFLASAYAQRAQAMTTGDIGLLDGLYDPASTTLLAFEKERGSFFKGGLSARWDNSPVLGYTASVQMLDLTLSGSTASARLYETLSAQWVPHTLQLSSEARAYRQKNPSAYQATLPRGPRGEITAGFGIRHEVTLVKGASGWRLAEDAYDERHLHAASPDLVPGSWAEVKWGPGPTGIQPDGPRATPPSTSDQLTALATYYNRGLAVQCAASNWQYYNPQYCNYNSCGGDCGNFVSQCFRAGGQSQDGRWYTFTGGCGTCGYSATYAGTDTWANNQYLRDWVNQNGVPRRGEPVPNPWQLKNGDIVNYHWPGGCGQDGFLVQQVAIVVDAANGPIISCHNPDVGGLNYFWLNSPCGPAVYHTFSTLYDYF